MIPRPRDFTQGQFKYKSTPAGTPPSDDDLTAVIADGLAASAMPGWRGVLNDAQIRSLVDVVKSMSPAFKAPPASPIEIAPRAEPSAASVARGETLYRDAGCSACHGENLRGGATLKDAKGYPVVSRDLTAPWTFRGGSSPDRHLASPDDRARTRADAGLRRRARRRPAVGHRQLSPRQPAHRALGVRRLASGPRRSA